MHMVQDMVHLSFATLTFRLVEYLKIFIEIEMCNVGLLRYFSVNLCLHKTKIFSDFFKSTTLHRLY